MTEDRDGYAPTYRRSIDQSDAFWLDAAEAVDWTKRPRQVWSPTKGWFPDGELNTCHNAVDRHVAAGRGQQTALIYESPVTGTTERYSYAYLQALVSRTAGMLTELGVAKGARVIIYMPMIPEAVFAMLACARIGAIHSVVFGGFAAAELAKRIDDAAPDVLLTASCGIEGQRVIPYMPLVREARGLAAHQIGHVVVVQRATQETDLQAPGEHDWRTLVAAAAPVPCVPLASSDPLYILYTSGTTGTPKGVVRDNGGHAVALLWSMAHIYGFSAGETFWAASDVGWVVGHSYIAYAPLLAGGTTILYEGKPVGTPDAGTFWRTIVRHGVDLLFTAPTALRAIRKEDPTAQFLRETGTGRLRAIFLAGERADPDTLQWAEDASGLPVVDHWWQTELGWPAVATCLGLGDDRRRHGSAGFPVPGYRFEILGEDGGARGAGETGAVAIRTPLPPGCYASLWNNKAGYSRSFAAFEGYYETGDAGHFDADGFLHVMGRTDDIINVAGHRLSTGQMEEIVAAHPDVAECAVIGADDALKGMVPIAFAVVKSGSPADASTRAAIVARVRKELGPVAALKTVHLVRALPKTRSGKILRAALRGVANHEHLQTPPTIEDPAVLDELRSLFAAEPLDASSGG
jgi:propionyl-CoA synthetase